MIDNFKGLLYYFRTWRTRRIVVFATVRRIHPRTVRFILDRWTRTLGVRARIIGSHWYRRVHEYVTHVRYVRTVWIWRRMIARCFRERFQALDQLRLRTGYRQISSLQLHFQIAHCKLENCESSLKIFVINGNDLSGVLMIYLSCPRVFQVASRAVVRMDCLRNSMALD